MVWRIGLEQENLTWLYVTNEGADQHAYVKYEKVMNALESCYTQNLDIQPWVCSWAGWFEPYLVAVPKNWFSDFEAQINFHML